MAWFMDPDGWRDESDEGPVDYLATYMKGHGELQICRYNYGEKYRITFNGEEIAQADNIAQAKQVALNYYNRWKQQLIAESYGAGDIKVAKYTGEYPNKPISVSDLRRRVR
jgi:hypothetical protein